MLVLALEIRHAAQSPDDRDRKLRKLAESLLQFWKESGRIHFLEEDQVLLPKYARHVRLDRDADIMRMLADHAAIRAQIEDLQGSLGENFSPEQVIELGRAFHDHVRLEEDRIFPRIEKVLSDKLNSLGLRLTRLHGQN